MCAEADEARLLRENEGLIYRATKKHCAAFPQIAADIIAAGRMGLLLAIRAHDESKGALSTVANFHILREVSVLIDASSEVHISSTQKARGAFVVSYSLDKPLRDDEEQTTGRDLLVSETPSPEEYCAANDERTKIRAAIAMLKEKPRAMLETYFGLRGDPDGSTYDAIGKAFGITREGARLSVALSIKKLRPVLAARGFK